MTAFSSRICVLSMLSIASTFFGVVVTNSLQLENAIISANAGGDSIIEFGNDISQTIRPFPFNSSSYFSATTNGSYTIDGQGFVYENLSPGIFEPCSFFARGNGNANTITLKDMTIRAMRARGGDGGTSYGGGGLGAGGGLFIGNGATVTIDNMTFENCAAVGGDSGPGQGGLGGGGGRWGHEWGLL